MNKKLIILYTIIAVFIAAVAIFISNKTKTEDFIKGVSYEKFYTEKVSTDNYNGVVQIKFNKSETEDESNNVTIKMYSVQQNYYKVEIVEDEFDSGVTIEDEKIKIPRLENFFGPESYLTVSDEGLEYKNVVNNEKGIVFKNRSSKELKEFYKEMDDLVKKINESFKERDKDLFEKSDEIKEKFEKVVETLEKMNELKFGVSEHIFYAKSLLESMEKHIKDDIDNLEEGEKLDNCEETYSYVCEMRNQKEHNEELKKEAKEFIEEYKKLKEVVKDDFELILKSRDDGYVLPSNYGESYLSDMNKEFDELEKEYYSVIQKQEDLKEDFLNNYVE